MTTTTLKMVVREMMKSCIEEGMTNGMKMITEVFNTGHGRTTAVGGMLTLKDTSIIHPRHFTMNTGPTKVTIINNGFRIMSDGLTMIRREDNRIIRKSMGPFEINHHLNINNLATLELKE